MKALRVPGQRLIVKSEKIIRTFKTCQKIQQQFKQLFSSHQKTIFGATFVDNNNFISWSSDCSVRLWDVNDISTSTDGIITTPKKISEITNFPILTAAVDKNQITNKIRLACAGGQSNNFLGSPVYFFKSFI